MMNNDRSIASASRDLPGTPSIAEERDRPWRGMMYKIFSIAFLYPSSEIAVFFSDPKLPEVLAAALGEGSELAAYFRSGRFRSEASELARLYDMLFPREGGVWLYESEYRSRHEFQRVENLADLNGFYRAFGLQVQQERPDHLSVELEFMHVLVMKELWARAADSPESPARWAVTREAERAFLRDHLAAWVPVLAQAIGRRARDVGLPSGTFYEHMVAALAQFLRSECAQLGVTPARDAFAERPEPEEDVGAFHCPFEPRLDCFPEDLSGLVEEAEPGGDPPEAGRGGDL